MPLTSARSQRLPLSTGNRCIVGTDQSTNRRTRDAEEEEVKLLTFVYRSAIGRERRGIGPEPFSNIINIKYASQLARSLPFSSLSSVGGSDPPTSFWCQDRGEQLNGVTASSSAPAGLTCSLQE
ncbi:hypothetical protein F2P81_001464 [Scophthalmus maximus]|uniref:Uncharacterized protein n=1 Tax=Scophthalmus maximus TaxID=52904 RepID=A0A6A4TI62_SCOMX|nr:hypothetical protein F2P81_001464 [Scophthalmus maximus]